MKKLILCATLLFLNIYILSAQRYMTEIFDEVEVQTDVEYGVNASIITLPFLGAPTTQSLLCDIYTPKGDTEINRPLAIIVHSGSFLPSQFNGGCNGTQKDADVVELAQRLTRMGYVTACIDYRLGWDPTNPDQIFRVVSFLEASYRGIQDLNTSVKFFRRSVAEMNNPYGIDSNKIVTIGFGSGGVLTYGGATVKATDDFWDSNLSLNTYGDINADNVGISQQGILAGDTLCFPNHVGYDANTQLSVQIGGVHLNQEWLSEGDSPLISYNVLAEDLPPVLTIPAVIVTPVEEVVFQLCDEFGINDIFSNNTFTDPYTTAANISNGGIDGLFYFSTEEEYGTEPWTYAYNSEPYGIAGSNCTTLTPEIQTYRDTIVEYFIPRACLALDLGCDLSDYLLEEEEELTEEEEEELEEEDNEAQEVELVAMPNPSEDQILLVSTGKAMESILLFNSFGEMMQENNNVNDHEYTLQRKGLPNGLYHVMMRYEGGYLAKKVSFQDN